MNFVKKDLKQICLDHEKLVKIPFG